MSWVGPPDDMIQCARRGERLSDRDALDLVERSYPYLCEILEGLTAELAAGREVAVWRVPRHDDDPVRDHAKRMQVLRGIGTEVNRRLLERRFGLAGLALQCSRSIGVCTARGRDSEDWATFVSLEDALAHEECAAEPPAAEPVRAG